MVVEGLYKKSHLGKEEGIVPFKTSRLLRINKQIVRTSPAFRPHLGGGVAKGNFEQILHDQIGRSVPNSGGGARGLNIDTSQENASRPTKSSDPRAQKFNTRWNIRPFAALPKNKQRGTNLAE